jgi:hypothetical protein
MSLLLIFIIIGTVLFSLVLFTPILFSVRLTLPDAKEIRVRLWEPLVQFNITESETCLTLAGLNIHFHSKTEGKKTKEKIKKKRKEKNKPGKTIKILSIFSDTYFLKTWLKAFAMFFKSLFSIVRFQVLSANLCIGLEDPAQTGKMMGYWYSLYSACGPFLPEKTDLRISPDFSRKQVSGTTDIKGSTSVFRIIFPLLVLLWHAPLYRTLKIIK